MEVMSSPLGMEAADYETIDSRFEFDAPRFYDFKTGSPEGEPLDNWFTTSATKGLATPEGVTMNTAPQLEVQGQAETEQAVETTTTTETETENSPPKQQIQQMQRQDSVPSTKEDEASQVRMVLAHIASNVSKTTPVAGRKVSTVAPLSGAPSTRSKSVAKPVEPAPAAVVEKPVVVVKEAIAQPPAAPVATQPSPPPRRFEAPAPKAVVVVEAPKPSRKKTPQKPVVVKEPAPAAVLPPRPPTRAAAAAPVAKATSVAKKPAMAPKTRPTTRSAAAAVPSSKNTKGPRWANPTQPRLTVPRSPMLLSRQRSAIHQQHQVKTTEEREMEEVAKGKQQAERLRKLNARTVRSVLTKQPRPVKHSTKPLTEPQGMNLRTSLRNRSHGMQTRSMGKTGKGTKSRTGSAAQRANTAGIRKRTARPAAPRAVSNRPKQLTLPKTPQFATKGRSRPSRYKPTEEAEIEQLKALPKFKARPVNKTVIQGRPVLPSSRPAAKPLTVPQPFRFATDARAAKRPASGSVDGHPPAFTFDMDKGPRVTRSRAKAVEFTEAPVQRRQPVEEAPSSSGDENPPLVFKRRRTTAGPLLLGGAMRVRANPIAEQEEEEQQQLQQQQQNGEDGMQELFKTSRRGSGRAMMHNPLFNGGM